MTNSSPQMDHVQAVRRLAVTAGLMVAADDIDRAAAAVDAAITAVFAGDRSVGKSCLINALVEHAGLLPVHDDVASNVEVKVGWAGSPGDAAATVSFQDRDEPLRIGLDEIASYAGEQANPANRLRVQRIDVLLRHRLLLDGLVLVDTPGGGGLVATHGELMRAAAKSADILVMVVDAQRPVSQPVLDFARETTDDERPVVFVFQRSDAAGLSAASSREDSRSRLSKVSPRLGEAPLLLTSALLAETLDEDDAELRAELLAESGIPLLRETLLELIPKVREIRRGELRKVLTGVLDLLAERETTQIRAADDPTQGYRKIARELEGYEAISLPADLLKRLDEAALKQRIHERADHAHAILTNEAARIGGHSDIEVLENRITQVYAEEWQAQAKLVHDRIVMAMADLIGDFSEQAAANPGSLQGTELRPMERTYTTKVAFDDVLDESERFLKRVTKVDAWTQVVSKVPRALFNAHQKAKDKRRRDAKEYLDNAKTIYRADLITANENYIHQEIRAADGELKRRLKERVQDARERLRLTERPPTDAELGRAREHLKTIEGLRSRIEGRNDADPS
ncbi:hypothetical protein Aple_020760 [Acrocarpospora pleiomorpha]|uniref:Dynamin N-terminal domain-containing protein n=1 Tax=Acrocarpospora pleiomorpha TaxID=90975 RepID=A0A5M3XDN7_9ACTN|nr:dynamin family protein [Acrocarpospora pleiomorpha]GES19180.1 hypothetical protein Aple_020760 [Acrocarpospora pleiomorpha]